MTDDGMQRTPLHPKGYAEQAEDRKRLAVLRPQSSVFRLRAFTLAESMVVVVIISLLILIAATNLKGVITKNSFKAKSQGLIAALEAASTSAGQSDKRYEVIIDIPQQSYLLREISSSNLADVLEEEIIAEEDFGANCEVSYVLFDDGQFTNEDRAKFRASRAGWQFGGIIVLLDSEGQPWSIIVDRLSNIVRVQPGEAQIVWPRSKDELPF
ncbi:MAG: prepilin-type N-terminal cleavage/methylation domain-containing protein [Sedimentisphaerales bacterium]|jgi:prepilin-type N-terminal cleavage/methylation domain-containing protein